MYVYISRSTSKALPIGVGMKPQIFSTVFSPIFNSSQLFSTLRSSSRPLLELVSTFLNLFSTLRNLFP